MRRKGRVRARALAVCSTGLCAALVTGCAAAGSSSVTASGTTLSIYVSVPPSGGPEAHDVIDAEQLAFQQLAGPPVGRFALKLIKVNGPELSDNARTAIQNTGAVAYLGEIEPGASAQSLGITNAQDLLQVSPTDNALELTQSTSAIPNTPKRYYEQLKTYGRTFARVVPSNMVEAKVQVQEMQALGVTRLYIAGDGSPYGLALAAALKTAAGSGGPTVVSSASGADGMFYAGASPALAAKAFQTAAAASGSIKLFGPSALDDSAFATAMGSGGRNVYISSPGFLPRDLTAAGTKFVTDFKQAYGHAPATGAIFGYAAMQGVIYAIQHTSPANDRAAVVKSLFPATGPKNSVLGPYSINSAGDISLAPFVFSRPRGGAMVPFKFVPVQG